MTETVFAGDQVEKLPLQKLGACFTSALAKFAQLAKDFLKNHRPRHAGNRNRQHEKLNNHLPIDEHVPLVRNRRADVVKVEAGG